jgi:UPF0716 family protein affecting phage T7 exclusion
MNALLPLVLLFATAVGLTLALLVGGVWVLSRLATHRASGRHRPPRRWRRGTP